MTQSSLTRRDFLKTAGAALISGASLPLLKNFLLEESDPFSPLKVNTNPNILIIIFDALSARNMSLYGYGRATTPNLSRLVERATVYHQHHSNGNFTTPGTASLLTGVLPWTHRAIHMRGQALEPFAQRNIFGFLPAQYYRFAYTQNPFAYVLLDQFRNSIDSLTKMGKLAEYDAVFSERMFPKDYYIPSEAEFTGFKEEFKRPASLLLGLLERLRLDQQTRAVVKENRDTYPRGLINCRIGNPAPQCFQLETAIDWTIAQIASAKNPFFGYLHYFPPHAPYNPRADFIDLFDDGFKAPKKEAFAKSKEHTQKSIDRQRRFYDQSIAHVDSEFGRLYDDLERSGVLENTMLILTTDHGELLERGILGHVTPALYAPLTHIPLIIFQPGQTERVDIHTPTAAIDLVPTMLKWSGAQLPAGLEGAVLPGFSDQPPDENRSIYTVEAKRSPKTGRLDKASYALLIYPYRLIRYTGNPELPDSQELYHLHNDPEELENLFIPDHPIGKELSAELDAKLKLVDGTVNYKK